MSEGFMKSALERALERAEKIEVPEEKLKEMEYRPQGERIAAAFLRDPKYDLASELRSINAEERTQISKVVESVLLQNLILPKKERDITGNEKVFRGLSILKRDERGIKQAKEQLDNLSNYYVQATKQNYEQLKAEFERTVSQAVQQQTGMNAKMKLNVEQSPEFQDKWRQLSGHLDMEYAKALADLKRLIAEMS